MSDSVLTAAVAQVPDQQVRDEVVSPKGSYIVQAPAGSGKTTLLVTRYLNLLCVVRQPEEILAITFTDKAAKEMKRRVLAQLLNPTSEIAEKALERSEQLGWNITLNSQRLKIQTIDSFAYSLVRRMPLESQLSLDYASLETAPSVYDDAAAEFFELMIKVKQDELVETIVKVLSIFDGDVSFGRRVLAEMLQRRHDWIKPMQTILTALRDGVASNQLFKQLEDTRNTYIEQLLNTIRSDFDDDLLKRCKDLCRYAAHNNDVFFGDFEHTSDWNFLGELFLTTQGVFRKSVNVSQGFPPCPYRDPPNIHQIDERARKKNEWLQVVDELQEKGYLDSLRVMKRLVSGEITGNQRDKFDSLCRGLPILLQKLNSVFRQRECIDYPELNFAAQRALTNNGEPTDLALALDYRISHILIDEYQDTSESQFDFFESVMASWSPESGNTFFAVGDPMQSIYRFRHANLQLFQRTFKEGLPNVTVHARKLSSNFRSAPALVKSVNTVFEHVLGSTENTNYSAVAFAESSPANYSIKLDDDVQTMELLLIQNDATGFEEAQEVAKRIEDIQKKFGYEESIALLVSARTRLSTYFSVFQDRGIKWKGVDIVKLVDAPVVQDLYSLVEAFNERRSKLAWMSVFRSPLCGLTLPDLEKLSEFETAEEMLACTKLSEQGDKLLSRVRCEFQRTLQESHLTFRSQIERLWYRLGGNLAYFDVDSLINAERFFELLESASRGGFRLDELWSKIDTEYVSESGKDADVEVMTIHKAKGLEFDHVLLVDTNRRTVADSHPLVHWLNYQRALLIAFNDLENPDPFYQFLLDEEKIRDSNEQKRLLYVAITRAKKTVSVYGRFKDENQKPEVSSLLKYLEPFFDDATVMSPETSTIEEPEVKSKMLFRLDPAFIWSEPVPDFEIDESFKLPIEVDATVDTPINFQLELVLGNLVHKELHRISRCDLNSELFDSNRTTSWRNFLQAEGMTNEDIPRMLERTARQLENVLADEKGRYILDRDHGDAQSEVSYTGYFDGKIQNVVVDRTFIDEQGIRWIVDYKTTAFSPTKKPEDIVKHSRQNYQTQLSGYARILQAIEDRPVKCVVYYTDVPLMVELEPE